MTKPREMQGPGNSDARCAVIIGVGEISHHPRPDEADLSAVELMVAALKAADQDAGGGVLTRADRLCVVRALTGPTAPHEAVAARLGIAPALRDTPYESSGDSPVKLLNDAANLIAAGAARIIAITGGEALAPGPPPEGQAAAPPNDSIRAALDGVSPFLKKYGIIMPLDVYPFYEHATRAAWGQSLAESLAETGLIWAGMSRVAEANPFAWLRKPLTPAEIITPAPDNPMVNFPYTRRMVANSRVNQGAALLVTSRAEALAMGVPEERLVYIGAGAASHEPDDYLARVSYAESAAMAESLNRALSLNALTAEDLDFVELYSCFPCIPKMARRILKWPAARALSVYGGLTFGGGPIANCMTHAAAAMVRKLREAGTHGLIFANGGFATHNHSIIMSRRPPAPGVLPRDYDYSLAAEVPAFNETYSGPAVIETYSVPYRRDGRPAGGAIIGRSPKGVRFVARIMADDAVTLALLTDGAREAVGASGLANQDSDGYVTWSTPG